MATTMRIRHVVPSRLLLLAAAGPARAQLLPPMSRSPTRPRRPPLNRSRLDGRTSPTSRFAARRSAHGSDEARFSGIAISATAAPSTFLRFTKDSRHAVVQRAGRPRRLSRSAVLGGAQRLRQGEGVVRVQLRSRCSSARTRGRSSAPTAACPRHPPHRRRDSERPAEQDAAVRQRRRAWRQPFDLRLKRTVAALQRDVHAPRATSTSPSRSGARRRTATSRGPARSASQRRGRAAGAGGDAHDRLGAALEWTNSRGSARVGYDGSFFRNDIQHARLGQPAARSPIRRRSVRCRAAMSLWPDSNLNAGNVSGAAEPAGAQPRDGVPVDRQLDAERPADSVHDQQRAAGHPARSADRRRPGARDEHELHASARGRPTRSGSSARYRSYDFDNRTPVFHVDQHGDVRHDRRGVRRRRHEPVQPQPQDVRRRRVVHAADATARSAPATRASRSTRRSARSTPRRRTRVRAVVRTRRASAG